MSSSPPVCLHCEETLDGELPASCDNCGALYCPFCQAAMSEAACEHVLATDENGSWNGWPFDALELPTMPAGLDSAADWSASQKREAFGSALPLLAAYD